MRVVLVAPPWVPVPPPAYGGTEAVIDTLARGLMAAGHDVLLFASGDSTCPVPVASVYREAVGMVPNASAAEIGHSYRAYEAALDFDADIIHDHTTVGPIYAMARRQVVTVTTNHGPFAGELLDVYRALRGQVPIVAISHDQASRADDVAVAAVIHHGLEPGQYPMGAGAGGYALFLGRMHPDKGVEVACRVARQADVPLVIAAKMREPLEYEYFDGVIKPLLGDGVEFIGEADFSTKRELLADAVCLLNPIQWPEPFGMVMIEALACGTPVVTRPVGSAPEIVDHGVTGVVVSTEAELSAGICRAASLDRNDCRQAVACRFSAHKMVERHVALYQSIVRRERSRSAA